MKRPHPKTERRRILSFLYGRFQQFPMEMPGPLDFEEGGLGPVQAQVPNLHYLNDRGLVELLVGYNPNSFSGVRITADGIDLVEDRYQFNLRFPPELGSEEEALGDLPRLVEQLVVEADLCPLDGEARHALRRDIEYLRDEVARPVHRWRRPVVHQVLEWIGAAFPAGEQHLPSLQPLRELVRGPLE